MASQVVLSIKRVSGPAGTCQEAQGSAGESSVSPGKDNGEFDDTPWRPRRDASTFSHSRWVAGPVRRDQVIGPDGTRSGRYQAGKSVMGHRVPPDPSDGGGPAPNQGRWESIVGDFPPAMGDP